MVNEPLVGIPEYALVLVFVRFVGLVPQNIVAVKVNVSPWSVAGNVKLRTWLLSGGFCELVGLTVRTTVLTVKPLTPEPSDPLMTTCTKSVSLFGLNIPNFHV